jgi:predicted CXXCH cytochrome family protein
LAAWPLLLLCAVVFADVRETPHNLIRSRDKGVDEKQVCVFCHTPALDVNQSATGAPPVWQKALTDNFVFTIYDDIGRLGLSKASVGSQSIACLSCHDANQADGSARISMDHPYGVPYRGANKSMSASVPAVKGDLTMPMREARHLLFLDDFREVSQGVVENRQVFWVSRQGVTARRTRADLPLYARAVTGLPSGSELTELEGLSVPHIECSSCHDPHARTATFLRVPPEESKLCLTCHDK